MGSRGGAEEVEDARDAGVSSEARRLYPRVHDDAEEAELRPPEGRAGAAHERPRGDLLHPGRRPQPPGALDRDDPRRPRQGPPRDSVPHHPRDPRHRWRRRPEAEPLEVRRQGAEGGGGVGHAPGGCPKTRGAAGPEVRVASHREVREHYDDPRKEVDGGADHVRRPGNDGGPGQAGPAEDVQVGYRQREAGRRGQVKTGRRLDLPGAGRGASRSTDVAVDAVDHRRRAAPCRALDGREAFRRAARRREQPWHRREEARGHAQDGGGQQGVRSLSLVTEGPNREGGRRLTPLFARIGQTRQSRESRDERGSGRTRWSRAGTSASWRTSMPGRRPRPSGSCITPAGRTSSVRCTKAPRRWTGWSRSRSAGSPSPPPPRPASGAIAASTSSTPPVTWTSPSRSSGRYACSTAPSPSSTRCRAWSLRPRPCGARRTSIVSPGSSTSTRWIASGPTTSAASRCSRADSVPTRCPSRSPSVVRTSTEGSST